jgi:hypothetical protein
MQAEEAKTGFDIHIVERIAQVEGIATAAARAAAEEVAEKMKADLDMARQSLSEAAALRDIMEAALDEASKIASKIAAQTAEQTESHLKISLEAAQEEINEVQEQINAALEDAREFSDSAASRTSEQIENYQRETIETLLGLRAYASGMRSEISNLYGKTADMTEKVFLAMNEAESIREVAKRVGNDVSTMKNTESRIAETEERINALVDQVAERFAMRRNGAILRRRKGETNEAR